MRRVLLFSVVLLSGCGRPLMTIKSARTPAPPAAGTTTTLGGMPFYRAAYRCVHTTTWLQPFYTVTLSVRPIDDKGKAGSVSFSDIRILTLSQVRSDAYRRLLTLTSLSSDTEDGVLGAWKDAALQQVPNLYSIDEAVLPMSGEATLSSNSVESERYVDTQTTYYFNQSRPFSGNANGTISLNSEGIASSVNAQVEDTTFSTVMSTLSVANILTSVSALAFDGGNPKFAFELSTTTRILQHIDSQPVANSTPPCMPVAPTEYVQGAMNVKIVDANTEVKDESTQKKKDKPSDGGSPK